MIFLILFSTPCYCIWWYDPFEPACIATWKHFDLTHNWCSWTPGWRSWGDRSTPSWSQTQSTEISRVSNSEDDSVSLHNHHFSVTNLIITIEGQMPKNTVRVGQGKKDQQQHLKSSEEQTTVKSSFQVTCKWSQPTKQSKAGKAEWLLPTGNFTTYLKHR